MVVVATVVVVFVVTIAAVVAVAAVAFAVAVAVVVADVARHHNLSSRNTYLRKAYEHLRIF